MSQGTYPSQVGVRSFCDGKHSLANKLHSEQTQSNERCHEFQYWVVHASRQAGDEYMWILQALMTLSSTPPLPQTQRQTLQILIFDTCLMKNIFPQWSMYTSAKNKNVNSSVHAQASRPPANMYRKSPFSIHVQASGPPNMYRKSPFSIHV